MSRACTSIVIKAVKIFLSNGSKFPRTKTESSSKRSIFVCKKSNNSPSTVPSVEVKQPSTSRHQ